VIKEKTKGVDKQLEAIELGAIYDKEEIQYEEMNKTNKEMKLIEELMNGKDGEILGRNSINMMDMNIWRLP
jgi:hypothetical protein